MKKRDTTKDTELRMDEAEFDRMMSRALGVAPPVAVKKSQPRKATRKKRR